MFIDHILSWAMFQLLEMFSDWNFWFILVPGPLNWSSRSAFSSCSVAGIFCGGIIYVMLPYCQLVQCCMSNLMSQYVENLGLVNRCVLKLTFMFVVTDKAEFSWQSGVSNMRVCFVHTCNGIQFSTSSVKDLVCKVMLSVLLISMWVSSVLQFAPASQKHSEGGLATWYCP